MLPIIAVGKIVSVLILSRFFFILNDVVIPENCQVITTSGLCPPSWYSLEDDVAHCRSRIGARGLVGNAISAFG